MKERERERGRERGREICITPSRPEDCYTQTIDGLLQLALSYMEPSPVKIRKVMIYFPTCLISSPPTLPNPISTILQFVGGIAVLDKPHIARSSLSATYLGVLPSPIHQPKKEGERSKKRIKQRRTEWGQSKIRHIQKERPYWFRMRGLPSTLSTSQSRRWSFRSHIARLFSRQARLQQFIPLTNHVQTNFKAIIEQ